LTSAAVAHAGNAPGVHGFESMLRFLVT